MRSEFTADFKDGGHSIKVKIDERGVWFRMLRVKDGPEYFVPYEVIYKLAAKIVALERKEK